LAWGKGIAIDGHITPAGGSVLDGLRLAPAFVVKAKLAIRIQKSIAEMDLTQRDAAARMGITQPKLSLIVRGKLDDISQAKLEACLRALGHDNEIAIGPRRSGMGEVMVRDATE
jgi:predicted XRE-type DNA-binding protein